MNHYWQFVEKYLPNYFNRDDVSFSNDLALKEEFLNLSNYERIQYGSINLKLIIESVENYKKIKG